MKAGSFFICNKKGYGNDVEISAQRVKGYIDGDVGVHKSGKCWIATHIPTGLKIITDDTKQGVTEKAQKICSAPDFETAVTLAKRGKYYKRFETARKNAE